MTGTGEGDAAARVRADRWQRQHGAATAGRLLWELPRRRAGPRDEIPGPSEKGEGDGLGGHSGKIVRKRGIWGGELVLVGSREGFDLLPHIHSDAIAQEKRLISGVGINANMKIR